MGKVLDFAPLAARPATLAKPLQKPCVEPLSHLTAREFVSSAIEFVATDFGRLVLLASIHDRETGAYHDAFAALAFEGDALNQAILELHHKAFCSWLSRDWRSQFEDVLNYCRAAGRAARQTAADWIVRADYSSLLPAGVPAKVQTSFNHAVELALATAYKQLA